MIYNMDYVKNLFSGDNKYKTVGLLIVLLCLIAASLYVYKKSISSKIKDTYAPNQEFVSNDADKSAVLYYFFLYLSQNSFFIRFLSRHLFII